MQSQRNEIMITIALHLFTLCEYLGTFMLIFASWNLQA